MNNDIERRYQDVEYEDKLRRGDQECPCPFCARTGSPELIIRHFTKHHPIYERRHAMLFAIENDELRPTPSKESPFIFGIEQYENEVEEHTVFSVEMYEAYFDSFETALEEALDRTTESDFSPPDPLEELERKRKRLETVESISSRQRRRYGQGWGKTKLDIFDRDSWGCRVCDATWNTDVIHVHHIEPARQFEDYDRMNESSNLIALCETCHRKFEGRWTDSDPGSFARRAREVRTSVTE